MLRIAHLSRLSLTRPHFQSLTRTLCSLQKPSSLSPSLSLSHNPITRAMSSADALTSNPEKRPRINGGGMTLPAPVPLVTSDMALAAAISACDKPWLQSSISSSDPQAASEPSADSNSGRKFIGTHNGTFHCDEAMGCFLLRLTSKFEDADVIRTRDQKVQYQKLRR